MDEAADNRANTTYVISTAESRNRVEANPKI
eukprot:CAMPEP_0197289316 /NCGR_PEP_ID=MMETSP0890-20130614/6558_1 /TAXON_ID=44058 ORGANISM="Aureoumbra lagunensis, Strain CCMP1510" /NCGR_SAMPLE_ID=MMETSP0890 /ASSEMBLY_ACC=CAM_ASM_000533 /LENGTH=30 /DNA_ID= /DNA_START= /DNA_END= /DNA_ORIENTATION=